jgi:DNA-binding Lrp family transcriptional regulator
VELPHCLYAAATARRDAKGKPLKGSAMLMLAYLWSYPKVAEPKQAFPGITRIAGLMGVSERTVHRARDQLEAAGLIERAGVETGFGKRKGWRLRVPCAPANMVAGWRCQVRGCPHAVRSRSANMVAVASPGLRKEPLAEPQEEPREGRCAPRPPCLSPEEVRRRQAVTAYARELAQELRVTLPPFPEQGLDGHIARALEACAGKSQTLGSVMRHVAERIAGGELKARRWVFFWTDFDQHLNDWELAA